MSRKHWLLVPSGLLALVICFFCRERPISYLDLKHAQSDLVAIGYCCTSDRADGRLAFGFMVTREPTDWLTVGSSVKTGPLGPDWHGKVWVATIGNRFQLETTPDTNDIRVWGNLVAFGDKALLDEIEGAIKSIRQTTFSKHG